MRPRGRYVRLALACGAVLLAAAGCPGGAVFLVCVAAWCWAAQRAGL